MTLNHFLLHDCLTDGVVADHAVLVNLALAKKLLHLLLR